MLTHRFMWSRLNLFSRLASLSVPDVNSELERKKCAFHALLAANDGSAFWKLAPAERERLAPEVRSL